MELSLDISALRQAYRGGSLTPRGLVAELRARIVAHDDPAVWIYLLTDEQLEAQLQRLEDHDPSSTHLPLYGIPFAIKDNIDVAGCPTTAACPDYAYTPAQTAPVVQQLLDAGAILIGKTNLDQFATGLSGTRSPYGVCRNAIDPRYLPGGSSAGSAVAVAAGLVSFALGTDTAGSGRVPAAFNNLVGLKPTRGLISTRGVVPACRSLDCVSIFALSIDDAGDVLKVAQGYDAQDPYSRPAPPARTASSGPVRIGIPGAHQLEFFGDPLARAQFERAVERARELGAEIVAVDFAPFRECAVLLYEGPWVAERLAAVGPFVANHPEQVHPVVLAIIQAGEQYSAFDTFEAMYTLAALQRAAAEVFAHIDLLLTPTAGTIHTVAEAQADPIRRNTKLGYYTNFVNLLDLAAVAVPAGMREDGLPFGVTLAAPAFTDARIAAFADSLHRAANLNMGATPFPLPPQRQTEELPVTGALRLAVNGAHMSGLPLNHQLLERDAQLVWQGRTAPRYRLFDLNQFDPPRPGLLRADEGVAVEVEVWDVPLEQFGSFMAAIPAPLGIGTIELEDGRWVKGFLCEALATREAPDISAYGSWRTYLSNRNTR